MCTWSFSFLLLIVYNLGVQGQFCPKKFLTNIHKIYRLMLLICNFSTINNQWKQLHFIKILCAIFGLKLSPYPQFICFRNYKQKLYETVLMSSTCIFRKLQKKKKKNIKLSSNPHFIYCSNYLTEPTCLYLTQLIVFSIG